MSYAAFGLAPLPPQSTVCADALAKCKKMAASQASIGGRSMAYEYCQKQHNACMVPPVPGGGDQMDVSPQLIAPPRPAPASPTIVTFAECGARYKECKAGSQGQAEATICDNAYNECVKLAGQADRPPPPENGYTLPPPDVQIAKPSFAAQYLTPTNLALAAGGTVVGWLVKGWLGAAVGAVALPGGNIVYQRLKKPAA